MDFRVSHRDERQQLRVNLEIKRGLRINRVQSMTEQIWRISKGSLCVGIIIKNGRCVEAAPIYAWCVTKTSFWLENYFQRKDYHVFKIAQGSK